MLQRAMTISVSGDDLYMRRITPAANPPYALISATEADIRSDVRLRSSLVISQSGNLVVSIVATLLIRAACIPQRHRICA